MTISSVPKNNRFPGFVGLKADESAPFIFSESFASPSAILLFYVDFYVYYV